jgi:hemerythrin-like domain-containing protein
MTIEPGAPADTSMMRITHQALRRDLDRAVAALRRPPPPADRQRSAIAEHLSWMMRFLHNHHESEDAGLYPLVRDRRPDASALLDDMAADHEAAAAVVKDVEAAAADYRIGDDGDQRATLLAALDRLQEVLLPHLRREEDEAMPVVSATITAAEWQALEHQYNLAPKSFVELGREGHWLIDDLSPADREIVLHLVPALPRFILLHGFARGYRRRKAACWGMPGTARRVQRAGHSEVVVDAPLDAVWDVVRDVTRVGEWSHECLEASWVGGATSAVAGARFRGRNRQGIFRWGRVCEVISSEPYALVWRTVPTTLYPDSSEWSIRLEDADGATRIEQSFRVVRAPKLLALVYGLIIPAHRDRSDALTDDLRRIGQVAAEAPVTTSAR